MLSSAHSYINKIKIEPEIYFENNNNKYERLKKSNFALKTLFQ